MNSRKNILINIIHFRGSLDQLKSELSTFPWDSVKLVTLVKTDILNAINLFYSSVINKEDLENWADILECRDDIEYENDSIKDAVHQLANPILFGILSVEHLMAISDEII